MDEKSEIMESNNSSTSSSVSTSPNLENASSNGESYDQQPKRRSSSSSLSNGFVDTTSLFELLNPSHAELSFKKTYNKVKNLQQFTKRHRDKFLNTTQIQDIEFDKLKSNVLKRLDLINDKLADTIQTSRLEKAFYSFSIYSIFLCGLIIGRYPTHFHIFYSFICLILLPIRFLTYYKKGYGYFLADICYYVNLLLLSYIWIFPNSSHLFVVCFAFTFGTLSWAVLTWRNSLVLHSVEKTTSAFIHVTPPVVVFVIAHQLPDDFKHERFSGAAKIENWNLVSGILWTSLYYLVWQSLYHYFITIKRADKIKAGRVTSFSWLRKSYAERPLGKFVNSLPGPFPVLAFTLIQYLYQLLTMVLCPIWFKHKHLGGLFLSFIFTWASYNGATYYVDIFGKKFEKEVYKLRDEIDALQNRELDKDTTDGAIKED